jgi:hypothetical protein
MMKMPDDVNPLNLLPIGDYSEWIILTSTACIAGMKVFGGFRALVDVRMACT